MIVSLIVWFVFGLLMAYLGVIGIITYGWYQLSQATIMPLTTNDVTVSVVIAVRNESDNIERLLEQLANQNYNKEMFNIIVVDDHSDDNTVKLVQDLITKIDLKINLVGASGEGKKNAIREGILNSSADFIVTTDGDCEVTSNWLSSIISYYSMEGCKVICGPVVYSNNKSLFQKFITLDFASLVASGAGSIGAGLPLMGNGANLAFEREIYGRFNDDSGKYASGDDVFLIHHVTKKYGSKAIGFLKNEDAIVTTPPPSGINSFLKQRARWASKAKGYYLIWPMLVSIIVFLFNMVLFLMLAGSIFFNWLLPIYFLIIITKFLIDIPLVQGYLSFCRIRKVAPWFFLMEFIYPIYIVVAVFASVFKFEWKGRSELN